MTDRLNNSLKNKEWWLTGNPTVNPTFLGQNNIARKEAIAEPYGAMYAQ